MISPWRPEITAWQPPECRRSSSKRHEDMIPMTTATARRAGQVIDDELADWRVRIGDGVCCVGLVDGGIFRAQLRTASAGLLLS